MTTMRMMCKDLGGAIPDAIQVIPAGFHSTPKGSFLCDPESAALVLADFEARRNDMVIDYEHQTLEGCEAPAAGWVKAHGLEDRGSDGIWAVGVEWTDKARAYIANREYRYLSPVFMVRNGDGRVISLLNVALTNQPNIDGMVPLVNKRPAAPGKETPAMKKQLCTTLGLAETASDADIIAAVTGLSSQSAMANKVLAAMELPADTTTDAALAALATRIEQAHILANKDVREALGITAATKPGDVAATILAMKQGDTNGAALAGKVAALEDTLKTRDASDAVTLAMKDGKITPAQKDWAEEYAKRDLDGFRTFVAKAPVVIPTGSLSRQTQEREEPTAQVLANKAAAYQAEQARNGVIISATEAVAHVKGGN